MRERRGGAGASARRTAESARSAERLAQHQRAKRWLPVYAVAAAVVGYIAAAAVNGAAGIVAGAGVLLYGCRRTYRRSANTWAVGAVGEVRTARLLAPLERGGAYAVLHDRAIRNSRANLDTLVLGPCGAIYVDTKNWRSKRSRVRVENGQLWYGRYPQTRALETVRWEAEQAARLLDVPVRPMVAVHGAAVPGGRLEVDGVTILTGRKLRRHLQNLPPVPGWDPARVAAVRLLADAQLPPHTA